MNSIAAVSATILIVSNPDQQAVEKVDLKKVHIRININGQQLQSPLTWAIYKHFKIYLPFKKVNSLYNNSTLVSNFPLAMGALANELVAGFIVVVEIVFHRGDMYEALDKSVGQLYKQAKVTDIAEDGFERIELMAHKLAMEILESLHFDGFILSFVGNAFSPGNVGCDDSEF